MTTTTIEVENNNAELSANNVPVQQTHVPWECTSACYHTPRKRLIQQRTTSQLLVFIFPTTTSTRKMFPDTTLTGRKCTCVFLGCVFLWSSQMVSRSVFLGDSTTCGGGIPPCTTKQQKWNGCGQLFANFRAYCCHIQFDNRPRQGAWQWWCRTGKRRWVVVITMWKLATVDGWLNVPTTVDFNVMSKKESVHHIANVMKQHNGQNNIDNNNKKNHCFHSGIIFWLEENGPTINQGRNKRTEYLVVEVTKTKEYAKWTRDCSINNNNAGTYERKRKLHSKESAVGQLINGNNLINHGFRHFHHGPCMLEHIPSWCLMSQSLEIVDKYGMVAGHFTQYYHVGGSFLWLVSSSTDTAKRPQAQTCRSKQTLTPMRTMPCQKLPPKQPVLLVKT